jgi:hypothetical protein
MHVEALFWSKNVFEDWDHSAIGKELILLCFAAVTQEGAYTRLKEDLLQHNTLIKNQIIE